MNLLLLGCVCVWCSVVSVIGAFGVLCVDVCAVRFVVVVLWLFACVVFD